MHISVLTPDREIFQGKIISVKVPGTLGQFQVLRNHAPIVSTLKKGEIKIDQNGKEQLFEVNGGVIEINHNKIIVLAD